MNKYHLFLVEKKTQDKFLWY